MGVRPSIAAAAVAVSAALFLSGCGSARPVPHGQLAEGAPAEVTATCTPGTGITVSSKVVAASADGVHVKLIDHSDRSDTYLHYGWNGQIVGGDLAKYQLPLTLPAPPDGDLQLRCSTSAGVEDADMMLVRVVDPHDFWSPPERPQDAGCHVDGVFYPRPPSKGPTEHAALAAMEADSWIDETFTFEIHRLVGGYRQADGGFRFVERRNGFATSTGWVGQADGLWSAQIDASCGERLGPAFDPMAGMSREQDSLRILCTPQGARLEPATVRVAPDGVRTEIVNRTGVQDLFLVYQGERDAKPEYLDIATHDLSRITWWQPGHERIGCTSEPTDPNALSAEVELTDPDRNWRPRTWDSDCRPTGAFYAEGGDGPTEQTALADLVQHHPVDGPTDPRIRLYDDGYWRRPGHQFVVLDDFGSTHEHLYGVSYPHPDGGWVASLDGTCRLT